MQSPYCLFCFLLWGCDSLLRARVSSVRARKHAGELPRRLVPLSPPQRAPASTSLANGQQVQLRRSHLGWTRHANRPRWRCGGTAAVAWVAPTGAGSRTVRCPCEEETRPVLGSGSTRDHDCLDVVRVPNDIGGCTGDVPQDKLFF
nr:hypothetical protein [Pandoravirus massiliensis]